MSEKHDRDLFINALNNLPEDILSAKYGGYNPEKKIKIAEMNTSKHSSCFMLYNAILIY